VLWGERDPYIDPRFAHAYAEALGAGAEARVIDGAGHWPWLDAPDVVTIATDFLLH
jgi:pimeloyl-ACP methyl ester carboxylesterase